MHSCLWAGLDRLRPIFVFAAILVAGFHPSLPEASVPAVERAAGTASATPGAATSVIPLEDYWELVKTTREQVNALEGAPPDTAHARLETVASQWEAIDSVLLPDGAVLPIDSSFIASQLRASPPDLERLESLLVVLVEARDAWPQKEFTAADLHALDRLLERPEFHWEPEERPSRLQELWERLVRRMWDFLVRLFGDRAANINLSPLEYGALALGLLTIGLVLFYALRGIRKSMISESDLGASAEPGDAGLTAERAFERAQEMSASGDYRLAVRYLYLSSLLLLDERGLLRYDRSRTNHEYLRSVAQRPELANALGAVVRVFDRVWYGYQALEEKDFADYQAHVADLRRQK